MPDLSKYFNRSEIACKCGCGLDTMDAETLRIADEAREFLMKPISPSSGARCLSHNRSIGSSDTSTHVQCRAMDLPVENPKRLYYFLCAKYPNKYGFGLYETFVHVDSRTNGPARWGKNITSLFARGD